MRLTDFDVLSLDCYGTLIDWESGLLTALHPLVERIDEPVAAETALETFLRLETEQEEATPDMPYTAVLAAVQVRLARAWGVRPNAAESRRFAASLPDWPPFADTVAALRALGQHYRLVILSNVDSASFAATQAVLGVPFHAVYTAEAIRSYKPDPRNFAYLIEQLGTQGVPRHRILHTAQSLFHDHVPAKAAGLATAWIGRRHTGADDMAVAPDFYFPSLAAMAAADRRARGG